jgi:DNA polymerase III alpha subunit
MPDKNLQTDDFILTRSFLMANVENMLENLGQRRQAKKIESDDLFGGGDSSSEPEEMKFITVFESQSKLDILLQEKDFLGLYLSGNPLQDYGELVAWIQDNTFRDDIYLIVINKIRKIFTKANKMMFALAISTPEQDLEAIIFPKRAMEFSPILQEKQLFWVKGKFSQKEKKEIEKVSEEGDVREFDELPKILIEEIQPFEKGIGPLFEKESLSLTANRQKMIDSLDWNLLKIQPHAFMDGSYKSITTQSEKPALEVKVETSEVITIKLGKSLGTAKLKEIKASLVKTPQESYKEVQIEVEGEAGWKKAKGTFWAPAEIVSMFE